ncbi:MAG: PIN domain-containing protein [Propionibacteriaceae bacterium]|nr:PIN domain-containing protein [Propionibacteriaceae bacterium]
MKPPQVPPDRPIRIYVADADVLYSRSLRDYLLYAMRARLIAVRWSGSILAEVIEHLMENRSGFTAASGERLVRAMNVAFPNAQVDPGPGDFAALVGLDLPDGDDRHVIAAALAAEAECICTHNVGDFPAEAMNTLGLRVVTPDDLLCPLVQDYPDSMLWVHHQALTFLPGSTNVSTIEALRKAHSPKTAILIAQALQQREKM